MVLIGHLAAMRAAFERGDLDEAARQGALAGPAVVERALASADRSTALAAIAAAPLVNDADELLPALAALAAGPDRRTAIPAADSARVIAHRLAHAAVADDDLAREELVAWRDAWARIARTKDRWIEVRVAAIGVEVELATALAVDPWVEGIAGVDPALLADADADVRLAALAYVPTAITGATRAAVTTLATSDAEDRVALAAGAILCGADGTLDAAAKTRVKAATAALAKASDARTVARCLK